MPLDKQSLQNTNTVKMVKQEDGYSQRVPQNMTVDKTQVHTFILNYVLIVMIKKKQSIMYVNIMLW